MIVIAIANQKGGVGKTTTAVTLASGFARRGRKTLLIDLDAQGHASLSLGVEKSEDLYRWLVQDKPLKQVVRSVKPGLDLIGSDRSTETVKRHIALLDFREQLLEQRLEKCNYDLVVLDLAPSVDVLHTNGLAACDWVIIPTRLDALAIDGVNEILLKMGELRQNGYDFDGYRLLPTFFERTTSETIAQFQQLINTFGENVLPPIPQDTHVREAAAFGKTVWEYCPNSPAVQGYAKGKNKQGGYAQLVERLLEVFDGR
ncbi:MAG: hypothetical protein BGO78_11900 [Chloroflexi bacterium 44-23]|nr:MAG: hypothetical protein BGO78_11900 [Chloroflexi bacterium 44-23]